MKCKNCGHGIIETKSYNGWMHSCVCERGSHFTCAYTGNEDSCNECECNKPEPTEGD